MIAAKRRYWTSVWKTRFPEFGVEMGEVRKAAVPKGILDKDRILDKSIDELELSVRAQNCLQSQGIRTINELIELDPYELLFIKNMGVRTVKEIIANLKTLI